MEDINKNQNERIKELEECNKTFLSSKIIFAIFATLTSLVVFSVGYSMTITLAVSTKVERNQEQYTAIMNQISQLQTDVSWIKRELNGK